MIRIELRKYIQFILGAFNLRLVKQSNYQRFMVSEVSYAHHKRLSFFDDDNVNSNLVRYLRRN